MTPRIEILKKYYLSIPTKLPPQFYYFVTGSSPNTCTVYLYYGRKAKLDMDDSIDGNIITEIEATTFNSNEKLKSITIPNSVTRID